MIDMTCQTCRFWDGSRGWCRRRASAVVGSRDQNLAEMLAVLIGWLRAKYLIRCAPTFATCSSDAYADGINGTNQMDGDANTAAWPTVRADDWCGEWTASKAKTKADWNAVKSKVHEGGIAGRAPQNG